MKYLKISPQTKLTDLINIVGSRNVDQVLHLNELERRPTIGSQLQQINESVTSTITNNIDWQRKSTILNSFVDDDDIFEQAALTDENSWKVLSSKMRFTDTLKIPESVMLPISTAVMGSGVGISTVIYKKAMEQLASDETGHTIDPSIFNDYSIMKPANLASYASSADVFQWFKLPWGKISLYSSISNSMMDFPVYPEEISDPRKANYEEMPELLYQYEPWYLYKSSGPSQNTFTFKFHRDMWTGDHRDGQANKLIRFCEANCYPEYNGSSVNIPYVIMYMAGKPLVRGIMTDVTAQWSGPIGLDDFYLYCELSLSITEVSDEPLNYYTVMNKPLIG